MSKWQVDTTKASGTTHSSGRGALCPWLAPVQAAQGGSKSRCQMLRFPDAWCQMVVLVVLVALH